MIKKKINKIFIKNDLLENLERSEKGVLGKDLKLKLTNGLTYQLTPAVKFKERVIGDSVKNLDGKFFTYEELSIYNYDIYMDTAIIDDSTVYSFDEGFSGILLTEDKKDEYNKNIQIIKKEITHSIEEHNVLKKTISSIEKIFSNEICDCYNVDILLEVFIENLGAHLKRENNFLYNDFKNNPKLNSLTKIYITSMDLINSLVTDYYKKWKTTEITTSNKDIFFEETKDIINILKDRIKQEEEVLFPVLLN